MNRLSAFVLTASMTASTLALALPVVAQDGSCFLLDESGQRIDLGALCGQGDRRDLKPGLYRVPILRRLGGIPVIEVTFNGEQRLEMMLDTGASSTVVSAEGAELLGLRREGYATVNTPSERGVRLAFGRVSSIDVGGATAQNVVVIVAPSLTTGLLGQNFFSKYDVSIRQDFIEFKRR
ncbi:putative aspartyl protease [Rubidibacter lacunae KORDI 51-2]|uniref:Putative aspartyl protease n=1 Tax=Rubidibacter lacunae KORDI 51-2 TaxID=582515 RepID=U5DPN9_9CHRO|nr:retropepsin-like aspartic protease [Rubidibacter lacunae]ERN42564.1 putative aspartyl protease [Rubidibacter lacunae KORDI 51-2]